MRAETNFISKPIHRRSDLSLRKLRSAITNGSTVLAGVDHRSAWMRRLTDLIHAHENDLGGADRLSEGQRCILRRVSMLQLQLEMIEAKLDANAGEATAQQLEVYQRCSNSLRRLVESLGLNSGRKARDVTSLGEILRGRRSEEARP
jgi:hypothetical protein